MAAKLLSHKHLPIQISFWVVLTIKGRNGKFNLTQSITSPIIIIAGCIASISSHLSSITYKTLLITEWLIFFMISRYKIIKYLLIGSMLKCRIQICSWVRWRNNNNVVISSCSDLRTSWRWVLSWRSPLNLIKSPFDPTDTIIQAIKTDKHLVS